MIFKPASAAALLALALVAASPAQAQFFQDNPDWRETEVPPPPAFDAKKLLAFEVSANPGMSYGVDPSTIVISKNDSLVRYVVVATSKSGVSNAMYEALHCATGEVKTYARRTGLSEWQMAKNPQWHSVFDSAPSRHSLAFAKVGACDAKAPATSVRDLVDKLKTTRLFLD